MRTRSVITVLIISILFSGTGLLTVYEPAGGEPNTRIDVEYNNSLTSRYVTHDPILIEYNGDFRPENGVVGGKGSAEEPYIIENLSITISEKYGRGIEITGTTRHFMIRNCYITKASPGLEYTIGIEIYDISYGVVENNTITNTYVGINMYDAYYSIISNNNCSSNEEDGIGVAWAYEDDTPGCIINNNTCSSNDDTGIRIDGRFFEIYNNTCNNNNRNGIRINSDSNIVYDNYCSYNEIGIVSGYHSTWNNTIKNNTCIFNSRCGIDLGGSSHRAIKNICTNNGKGIETEGDNNMIINNNCSYNKDGIYIDRSSGENTIEKNICNFNIYSGIYISGKSNKVFNNELSNNRIGLYINEDATNNNIDNNTCNGNSEFGLYIYYYNLDSSNKISKSNIINGERPELYFNVKGTCANPIVIKDKIFQGNKICNLGRIFLYACEYFIIENNTLLGTEGVSPVDNTIRDYEGIVLYKSNNIELKSNRFINMTSIGIDLYQSDHNYISNNYCSNNSIGINLYWSNYNVIANNTCLDSGISIRIDYSKLNNLIINNTCLYNTYGIALLETDSTNNIIANNNCSYNNWSGIWVFTYGSMVITNNTCNNNRLGIDIDHANDNIIDNNTCFNNDYGLDLEWSDQNTVSNNSLSYNNYNGIRLSYSDTNYIVNNEIYDNSKYGIILATSSGNVVHHNDFINNGLGLTSQGHDDGTTNQWYDAYPFGGNYWSDYTGYDNNSDGIGDSPYVIAGGLNWDNYPLIKYPKKIFDSMLPKIEVELDFVRSTYYSGEEITGTLVVTNNNNFDIYTVDPQIYPYSNWSSWNIKFEFENTDTRKIFYNKDYGVAKILKNSNASLNLSLDGYFNYDESFNSFFKTNLLAGSYSIRGSFEVYLNTTAKRKIMFNTPELITIQNFNVIENLTVTLELTKTEFQVGEPITGTVTFENNNYIDIYFGGGPFVTSIVYGNSYSIYSLDDYESKGGLGNYDINTRVRARSSKTVEFIVGRHIDNLIAGNYLIYASFYIYNETDYIHNLNMNCSSILSIRSNEVEFQVVQEDLAGIENISITIKLNKTEFYFGEPITGTVQVSNKNLFDVTLSDIGIQRLLGDHFKIYSMDNYSIYRGLSEHDLYPINIKALETTNIEFKIESFVLVSITSKDFNYLNLPIGNYSLYAIIYYGQFDNYSLIWSEKNEFEIVKNITIDIVDVDKPTITPEPPDSSTGEKSSLNQRTITFSIAGIAIVIIVISAAFIAATEVGKYGFYAAVGPLYTKQRRKKGVEYGYIKGSVRGYILGNPGESYNAIKRVLDMPNGTLAYYLKVLETEGIIRSERDGKLKRFYPADGRIASDVLELTSIQKEIYDVAKDNPGISQKEISSRLDITQQRVNYQIKLMADARLIKVERAGKKTKCFVIDDN